MVNIGVSAAAHQPLRFLLMQSLDEEELQTHALLQIPQNFHKGHLLINRRLSSHMRCQVKEILSAPRRTTASWTPST
jgi:hypothetical protein